MNNNDYPLAVRTKMEKNQTSVKFGYASRWSCGPSAILIRWRDEWPPIEEVPLAGETVWWKGDPVTIIGVPMKRDGAWRIPAVRDDDAVFTPPISSLSRTPPVEKVTGDRVGRISVSNVAGKKSIEFDIDALSPGSYIIVKEEDTTND